MVMGNIELFLRNIIPPFIRQVEMDLFPFIIQPRPECLLRLRPLIRNAVYFFTHRKTGARLDKVECNIIKTSHPSSLA